MLAAMSEKKGMGREIGKQPGNGVVQEWEGVGSFLKNKGQNPRN